MTGADEKLEMDRNALFQKLKVFKSGRIAKALVIVLAFIGLTAVLRSPTLRIQTKLLVHSALGYLSIGEFFDVYSEAWKSVQAKVDSLQTAEEEKQRLLLDNAQLRMKLESARFECKAERAQKATRELGLKLNRETGSRVGRTLAGIRYSPPDNLTPNQLLMLGESYFKARDDEKAAVIFTLLTGLENNDLYKTPKNFLVTGIAWYRLDNFELADSYFDKVLAPDETADTLRFRAQARLWKALSSARVGRNTKAQYWLRELVDHHPHSMEAKWVNSSQEVERATASED